jgi:hypothetical protein
MQKTALFWHGLGQIKKFNFLLLPLFYLRRLHISSNTSVDKFLRIFLQQITMTVFNIKSDEELILENLRV